MSEPPGDQGTERTGISKLFGEHFALAASAALVLLSVVRVYYFSAFSPDVALTVLSVVNRTQVLVSTLLNFLAVFAPFLIFIRPYRKWFFAGYNPGASTSVRMIAAVACLPLAPLLASALSPVALASIGAGVLIVWAVSGEDRRRKELRRSVLALIATVATILMLILPWQPLEKITLQSADNPVVGYVMGEQAGKTLIIDRFRQPLWIKSDEVNGRELCAKKDTWLGITLSTHISNLINRPPRPQGVDCS
ncbi:hypothetical protein [Arthrobacter sp. ISL-5]|uniref:hypothetical protein n=1 Tax=Arthrobacter sp. ISL-5 TaxID=2819111 RepID=UPI001BE85DFB|nr:hypothetical protein [Arthrobacter sp. ISL-5]MBT2555632.1 hypothetical protein [Arthrobacter sp. ISL-5]